MVLPDLAALEVKLKGNFEIKVRVTFTSAEMRPEPSEEDQAGKNERFVLKVFFVYFLVALFLCVCVSLSLVVYSMSCLLVISLVWLSCQV
jgi:hypothetical protein